MFTDSLSTEQWRERIRFSTSRDLSWLCLAMKSPSYAAARRMGAGPAGMILALAEAELAHREQVKAAAVASKRVTATYIGPMSDF